jgi:hypothetical protein
MAGILNRPDQIFEAQFFSTDDGPVWVDLSSYIELQAGLKTGRRRQTVFDDVAPGTLSLSLDNSTGIFNTDKAGSPFLGLVGLDVPVRYRLRWPNVGSTANPGSTRNLLSAGQSTGSDPNQFSADQGGIDVDTVSPPAGQASDIIWSTGVLDQTGVGVVTGDNASRAPCDQPVYVTPGLTYSFRQQVKCDTAGTGITFKVSLRMRWFSINGTLLSETTGVVTTLTTSYQSLSVSAAAPANAATVRVGVFSETVVAPVSRAIAFTGSDGEYVNSDHAYLTIPPSASVGDLAFAWYRVADKNLTVASAPAGWTLAYQLTDAKSRTVIYLKALTAADLGKRFLWSLTGKGKQLLLLTCYSGVNQVTPVNVHTEAAETVFRPGHICNSVTTTLANCMQVSAVFDSATATGSWSAPVGEIVRAIGQGSGGNSPAGIVTDDGTQHAIGVQVAKTFTANVSSRYATAHTIALAPSAGGTGPGNVNVQMGAWELVQGSLTSWQAGGTWANKFTGLTDSWTETFSGNLVLTSVQATDRQKQLTTIDVGSALYETVMSHSPVAYYRLDDSGSGTTTPEAANCAEVPQPTLQPVQFGSGLGAGGSEALMWGQGTGPGVDGSAALVVNCADASDGYGLRCVLDNPIAHAGAVTLAVWANSTMTDATVEHTLIRLQDSTNGLNPRASLDLRGKAGGSPYMAARGEVRSDAYDLTVKPTAFALYYDGKTHFLAATYELTGGQLVVTFYVDGVQVGQSTATSGGLTEFPTLTRLGVSNSVTQGLLTPGTFSNAAVFDHALSADDIADMWKAGSTAFAGDTTDQRIGRLCAWENQGGLNLGASTTILDRHMPDTQSLLSAIQQAARSEGGVTYVDGDGDIAFISRAVKEATGTPALIVPADQVDPSFTKVTDDQLFTNKASVTRLATAVATVMTDQPSIDAHEVHERDIETILSSNQDASNYAAYVMAFYSEPMPRCDQVKIDAMLLQNWAAIMSLDMWQILRVSAMPATEQSSTIDFYIEGWDIEADENHWYVTFDTSTAIPFAIVSDPARGVCGPNVVGW